MLALPTDEMFSEGDSDDDDFVAYVKSHLPFYTNSHHIERAPEDVVDIDVVVAFDEDDLAHATTRILQHYANDDRIEFAYVGIDKYGYDFHVSLKERV